MRQSNVCALCVLLFSQIYKGRPAFVRNCAIHILVRNIHYFIRDYRVHVFFVCVIRYIHYQSFVLGDHCSALTKESAYSVWYNVQYIFFQKSLRLSIKISELNYMPLGREIVKHYFLDHKKISFNHWNKSNDYFLFWNASSILMSNVTFL